MEQESRTETAASPEAEATAADDAALGSLHVWNLPTDPPRLVLRNLPFDQSRNIVQVEHNQGTAQIGRLIRHDFFHVLLRLSTSQIIFLVIFCWTFIILFFAAMFVAADRHHGAGVCSNGLRGEPWYYYSAFGFALQTSVSTGFGTPNFSNAYFEHCPAFVTAVYFEMGVCLFFNAFLVGIFITRIANSANRAVQVVFSNRAIVSVIGGQVRFQFRVFDVDARHPVVDPQVRLFAVAKDRPVPRRLRTLQPNDELGGQLFLSLPQVVSHHIDIYSMLHPPVGAEETGHENKEFRPIVCHKNQGFTLRQADSLTNGRKEVVCPVCGAAQGSHERWARHVEYMQLLERQAKAPVDGTHLAIPSRAVSEDRHRPVMDLQALKSHFQQSISEVICVVEGSDPLTAGTFTALYSYRAEDVVWDNGSLYSPCIRVDAGMFNVDLDRFHDIISKPKGRLQQLSLRLHDSFFRAAEEQSKTLDIPQLIAEENEEEEMAAADSPH